jgi:hypothetical protein
VLDLNPFATGRALGAPDTLGDWAYDATPEIGVNASWGIATNLSLDATINPDFSQVEADVGQVTVNERFAIFFPEKRPFFLEGIEQFNTQNSLIYTRRIRNPIAGAKLTGKVSGTDIGIVSVVDDREASASRADYPVISALRIRRDVGGASTVGATYTDRIEGSDYNRMASGDARLVFAKLYFFEVQGAFSATRTDGDTRTGSLWQVTFDRTGRNWGFNYNIKGIHPDFVAATGFVPRTGIVEPFIANRLTAYGGEGAFLENWTGFFLLNGVWEYDTFFDGGSPLESNVGHTTFLTLRGGWSINITPAWNTVAFDPGFYADYSVDRGADTVAFAIPDRLNDLVSTGMSISTPQFPSFAASVGTRIGRTASFFEPAAANSFSFNATVDWRPTDQMRVQARYAYATLNRTRDGSRLSTAHIPRLKIEYQLSRPIFLRFIGQYNAQEQDALRDPATDFPILIADEDGTLVSAEASGNNDLRIDWLFSYRPTPGTVVFAGYGASLTETDAFTFRNLQRVEDGFFVKVSYLFRL